MVNSPTCNTMEAPPVLFKGLHRYEAKPTQAAA